MKRSDDEYFELFPVCVPRWIVWSNILTFALLFTVLLLAVLYNITEHNQLSNLFQKRVARSLQREGPLRIQAQLIFTTDGSVDPERLGRSSTEILDSFYEDFAQFIDGFTDETKTARSNPTTVVEFV